jgi:hypothetical protein
MVEVAQLTRPKIRRQVGEASLDKAKSYLRDDAWSDLRTQGQTIKGHCQGQMPQPYRVAVTFDGDAIATAECSCPVGGGGHCKHVAALLLYYREHPDAFVEIEELEPALERRSKGELVALILRMIRRVPELELLLEAPLPGYSDTAATDDPEPFRRQAAAAFAHGGPDWGAAPGISRELADIVAVGDEFRAAGNVPAAVAAYRGVADVVLEHLFSIDDEEGDLLGVVGDCAAGLCACLEALPSDDTRRDDLLRALVDLFVADEAHGGLGVSDSVPEAILHRTTPEERRRVAGWVRERLPKGDGWSDEYQRRELGSFLLELEADDLDDESYLRLCRETGRTEELVERLLTLGRMNDALKTVKAADDASLTVLADLLVQHVHAQEAEWLVEDRAAKSPAGTHFLEWLRRQAQARHDRAAALKWTEQLFQRQPSLAEYQELRRQTPASDWPARRERLLADLQRARNAWQLVEILLDEQEVGRALMVVNAPWGRRAAQRLNVAKAAEKDFPREALALYREEAELFIGQRGREAYRAACGHLRKMRDLYVRLDELTAWDLYVSGVRAQHRTLRALLEELERAKL